MAELNLEEITRVDLENTSSVYGPVHSWRVGLSLGVDLLCLNSICSFNCTYCQLGYIQVRINERYLFVPTDKLIADLAESDWKSSDIITFSGSGDPCLALNLGEAIDALKSITKKPTLVLTNGSLIHDPEVRKELGLSDRVYVKLDAGTEASFQRINRPVAGLSLDRIVEGAAELRSSYAGCLGVQMMILRPNAEEIENMALLLLKIRPDEVQLNTPTRPYPQDWFLQSRGSHDGVDYPAKPVKPISREKARDLALRLVEMTGLNVVSV